MNLNKVSLTSKCISGGLLNINNLNIWITLQELELKNIVLRGTSELYYSLLYLLKKFIFLNMQKWNYNSNNFSNRIL